MNHIKSVIFSLAVLLTGCVAAPNINTSPEEFQPILVGKFPPRDTARMADCLMDGYERSLARPFVYTEAKQHVRATGYRIELVTAAVQSLITEVNSSGDLLLLRTTKWNRINTEDAEAVAKACLAKYAAPAN